MLAVQKFLLEQAGTLEQLSNDLGIKIVKHPTENLVILNYSQIDSPKSHPVVRNCRGLTLELDSWKVIGRSFDRFYNWNEMADEMPLFNWNSCSASHKEDGSLLILYFWNGIWQVNTRGSFGNLECGHSGKSWQELFFELIPLEQVELCCAPGMSFVFEFCSPYNKVVRSYPTPTLFLLSVFDTTTDYELTSRYVDVIAKQLQCNRPEQFTFKSIDEVIEYVKTEGDKDATFEGIVIHDGKQRWKCKNSLYVNLHHLKDNGNIYNPKNLVPLIMSGEIEETLAYFPELWDKAKEMKLEIDRAYDHVVELWQETKDIASQRDFAQAIVPRTKFSNILFRARQTGNSIEDLWKISEDLILKVLYSC